MHLSLICLGHNQPQWVIDGTDAYAKRFSRQWPFTLTELRAEKRSEGKPIEPLLAAEAVRVRAQIPRGAALIALDERGAALTSRDLAEKLQTTAREFSHAAFVIGSADGLDPSLKQRATWQWSLSPLTLPHGLARILTVEQLYRAISLIDGQPYHRD